MKKKQYYMGRKHMQFYITFDEKDSVFCNRRNALYRS